MRRLAILSAAAALALGLPACGADDASEDIRKDAEKATEDVRKEGEELKRSLEQGDPGKIKTEAQELERETRQSATELEQKGRELEDRYTP